MSAPGRPASNPEGGLSVGSRLAWGTAVLWAENLLRLVTVALISVLIARALGPGPFGLLNLASAMAALASVALSRGLEWPLLTRVAQGRLDALSATALLLRRRAGVAVLAMALVGVAGWVLRPGDGLALAVFVVVSLSLLAAVPLGCELPFKAAADPLPGALARLAGTLLAALAKLAMLAMLDHGWTVQQVVLGLAGTVVLESAIVAGLLAWQWRRLRSDTAVPRPAAAIDAATARDLQTEAWPLWAAALGGVALLKLDVLVVGARLGDEAAGHYALAQKLLEVLCLAPVLLLDLLRPLRAHEQDAGRAMDLAVAIGCLVALANLLLAPRLVATVFGAEYAASVLPLQVLGLALPLMALDAARQRWLAGRAGPAEAALPRLGRHFGLALAVALPLAWLLAPVGGGAAVALCTLLGWAVATLVAPALEVGSRPQAVRAWKALWPWGRLWRLLPQLRLARPAKAGVGSAAVHDDAAPFRVLFVHQSSDLYGSDRALLHAVDALQAQGGEAIVVLPGEGPLVAELERRQADVHTLPAATLLKLERAALSLPGLWRLAGQLGPALHRLDGVVAGRRIDLVHTQTLAVLAGAWWAWYRRVPHLWHVHEIVEQPRVLAPLFPWLLRIAADRVVCNAHATAAWVLARQPVLRERVAVVWNSTEGLDAPAPEPGSPAANGPLRIGLIGRINRMKGQRVLVEAAEHLAGDPALPAFEIVFAGDAPAGQPQWQRWLQDRVALSVLADRIRLLGFVHDVPALLQTLDVVCVPSIQAESFGLVALEAMAAGVPVVASRVGGLPEVLGQGECGLLVPPGDARALAQALRRLLSDAGLRQRLGTAGQRRSRDAFDPVHWGRELVRQQRLAAAAGTAPASLPAWPVQVP
jgi:glycosyltransferase involved in cell wall biosynthesis/O-antigen/teichoic acid export membrane protein